MFENQELANWLEACLKEIFQQEESRKIGSACVVARCAERECGQLSDVTERDLQTQRAVYRMLYAELKNRQCSCKAEGGNADG